MDLKNKKVVVVGLGNSGRNAAMLLDDIGAEAWVTDSKDTAGARANAESLRARDIKFEIGNHTKEFVEGSSLLVVSPGVLDSSPALKWAEEFKIPAISELELAFRFCKGKIIAITGTNGKSTVTTLIGHILKDAGKDAVVCGNIGNALSGEVGRIERETLVVLEVSSFQLERIEKFKPHTAVILNITDDHLDRYKDFGQYSNEKLKIFSNQGEDDFLILNHDAANVRELDGRSRSKTLYFSKSTKVNGAYAKGGMMRISLEGKDRELFSIKEIKLKGLHNLENVLVSCLVAAMNGVSAESMKRSVRDFKGLRHRFETVDTIEGVEYIDDSKGTTVDSTYRALESCAKPVILIAGGKDKHGDYGRISELIKKKAKHLILIGEARDSIRSALAGAVDTRDAATLPEAVMTAANLAKRGDAIVLSPMCSSFDMFRDYKERGEVFRETVRTMKAISAGRKGI